MKIRNGFVSNSSSASFVIHWRMKSFGKKVTIRSALSKLYGINSYCSGLDDYRFDKNWTQDYEKTVKNIESCTIQNEDGTFVTNFFTTMMNSYDDFGESACSFALALIADDNSVIIDTQLDSDH